MESPEPDWLHFGRILYEAEVYAWPATDGGDPPWEKLDDDERAFYAAMARVVITEFVATR